MFNFGLGEMVILGIIALIFIGPKQLPEMARTIAKFVNEWRRTANDLSHSLMEAKDQTESAVRDAMDFDIDVEPVGSSENSAEEDLVNNKSDEVATDPDSKNQGD